MKITGILWSGGRAEVNSARYPTVKKIEEIELRIYHIHYENGTVVRVFDPIQVWGKGY